MSRYIDADALIETLHKKVKTDYEMGIYTHAVLTESFIHLVERQPTADVVEVNEGVIVPPCKLGQTVYKVVADNRVKNPIEYVVVGLWTSVNFNYAHLTRYVNGVFEDAIQIQLTDFGKTVFLTKEEAEKAFAERNKR